MSGKEIITVCLIASAQLASDYGNDPSITSLLDKMDVFLLPVTNPDGYEFTHTTVSKHIAPLSRLRKLSCSPKPTTVREIGSESPFADVVIYKRCCRI